MSKHIAIVFSDSSLEKRRGIMNAVLAHVEHLQKICEYAIDVFCLVPDETWLARSLRRTRKRQWPTQKAIDGVVINIIPYTFSFLGYILEKKLQGTDLIKCNQMQKFAAKFKAYDLISAHSTMAAHLAYLANKQFNVPFTVTWHGTDIHTLPWLNRNIFRLTQQIIRKAEHNIFVSKALLQLSEAIEKGSNKSILYNAASADFYCYSKEKKAELRQRYDLSDDGKVVLYAGNFVKVKNADLLPEIFESIQRLVGKKTQFLLAGDGDLRPTIEQKLVSLDIDCKLLGNIDAHEMPDLMNCCDILVLPSRNEGLPLVVVEAKRCGCLVVASDVGGVAEAIGKQDVVALGENFVNRFAQCVAEALSRNTSTPIADDFDWIRIASQENEIYCQVLAK